jgi:hypothetical protein
VVLEAEGEDGKFANAEFAGEGIDDPVEDVGVVDFVAVDVGTGLSSGGVGWRGLGWDVDLSRPVVAVGGIGGVGEFKAQGPNGLEKLVFFVDDFNKYAVAIGGGDPGKKDSELNGSRGDFSGSKFIKG